MIALISMGLFDEKDLTLRGIEETRKSGKVYIEFYTGKWHGNLKNLEKMIGKKVTELKRSDLEENSRKIVDEAKKQDIAILIQGSAVVQTTHLALIEEAKKLGIKTKIIHNASIISTIGETGLHPQKFGQYTTIPFPERTKGKLPKSVFEVIKENQKRGLHTLCLLDLDMENNRYMFLGEALTILIKGKVVSEDSKIVVFASVGSDRPLIAYGKVKSLINRNVTNIPAILIVPGRLHYTEDEFLKLYTVV
jgi:diphthine synthase